MRPAAAAIAYALTVFALGFMLGVVRTIWLAGQIGAVAAVLVELPIMLLASWAIAQRLVVHARIETATQALAMGGFALALLLLLELGLALALGGSVSGWRAALATPPGALGLAGQGLFALLPLMALQLRKRG